MLTSLMFGKIIVAKKKFYGVKTPMNTWKVNVDNIVISK